MLRARPEPRRRAARITTFGGGGSVDRHGIVRSEGWCRKAQLRRRARVAAPVREDPPPSPPTRRVLSAAGLANRPTVSGPRGFQADRQWWPLPLPLPLPFFATGDALGSNDGTASNEGWSTATSNDGSAEDDGATIAAGPRGGGAGPAVALTSPIPITPA